MDQYSDVIIIDPNANANDARNATVTRDRRDNRQTNTGMVLRVPTAPTVITAPQAPPNPPYYPYPPTPPWYPNLQYPNQTRDWPTNWPPFPGYVPGSFPPGYPFGLGMGGIGSWISGIGGVGALIDTAAQLVAALMPLPAASDFGGDGDRSIDDLVDYQSRLAKAAKIDELIRTGGSILKTLTKGVR